jgi:hypothetical protein
LKPAFGDRRAPRVGSFITAAGDGPPQWSGSHGVACRPSFWRCCGQRKDWPLALFQGRWPVSPMTACAASSMAHGYGAQHGAGLGRCDHGASEPGCSILACRELGRFVFWACIAPGVGGPLGSGFALDREQDQLEFVTWASGAGILRARRSGRARRLVSRQ